MIRAYALAGDRLKLVPPEADDVFWWDLVTPDRSEETCLGSGPINLLERRAVV